MTGRIPPLYALRAFEVAARAGSFTRAAEELSLTQSAVSRHIKNLEEIFGCRLFSRNGPRIQLTEPGKNLALELSEGFRTIENACHLLKHGMRGVRMKAPTSLTARWLLKVLRQYKKELPDEEIHLSSVWMDIDTIDFHSEPYECAILLGNGDFGRNVLTLKLIDEWLIPICSAEVARHLGPTANGLPDAPLIHPSPDRRDWKRWLETLNYPRDIGGHGGLVFDTLDQGILAAIQGHGISMGDLSMVASEVRSGALALPVRTAVHTGDGYYLIWPKGSPQKSTIRRLGTFLVDHAPRIDDLGVDFVS